MMWIELHDSARDHPKIIKLARALGINQAQALGHMCALWTWTLRMAADGNLSSFEPGDIEIGALWEGDEGALFEAASRLRLLESRDGDVIVHDWDEFSGSLKSAKRARAYRQRKKKESPCVTVTSRDSTVISRRPNDRTTDRTNERGEQFTTSPPPSLPPPNRVTDEHEQAIHRLREHHAKLHGIQPRGFLTNREDLERIAKALDEYGEDGCRQIIEGHHARCKAGNEKRTGFVFAFPWAKNNRSEPDWDWTAEMAAGKKKTHAIGSQPSDPEETMEERRKRIEKMAQESIAREMESCGEDSES